ncbi:DUF5709 domain-containing protein [Ornithinimicrobium cavernae]|uniref:DUF5709 domain-containing protein n=1 Tax=Ornithinimicrobium cavernae TaxID=2666047 RepID=UPI000D6866A2|nr:DUF5709 domain-containing protein [Ornithinimicrobium cavernae]
MSDQPGRESLTDEYGATYSLDDEDQLQPEDTLVGDEDPLDAGYQTAERLHGSRAWGTTPDEQRTDETINQRIGQEVPDPHSAYGAPDNESGLDEDPRDRVGGDDPDSIPAERDFLGEQGGEVGQLVSPDEGMREDTEKDLVAADEPEIGGESAEEDAMRYTTEDTEQFED